MRGWRENHAVSSSREKTGSSCTSCCLPRRPKRKHTVDFHGRIHTHTHTHTMDVLRYMYTIVGLQSTECVSNLIFDFNEVKVLQRLTLNTYLLHLRHLWDWFLQVFYELEQLFGTLGTEGKYLLLVWAKRWEDGDAVRIIWGSAADIQFSPNRSKKRHGKNSLQEFYTTGIKIPFGCRFNVVLLLEIL